MLYNYNYIIIISYSMLIHNHLISNRLIIDNVYIRRATLNWAG